VTNPYLAPGAQDVPREEDDIAAAAPPLIAKIAGGVVVLAGAVVALTAAQTWMITRRLYPPYDLFPWTQILLGVPAIVIGTMVFRARAWAAMAAIALGFLLFLVSAFWMVVSFAHGLFSLFALGAPFVALGSFVLVIIALGPCMRATRARERMAKAGMSLGL
jgi:hypothetical protein